MEEKGGALGMVHQLNHHRMNGGGHHHGTSSSIIIHHKSGAPGADAAGFMMSPPLSGHPLSSANDEQVNLCSGCFRPIVEQFLLKALDCFWHEDCLKCGCCGCRLGEVGSTLYTRANLILCKRDYLRLFGRTGNCAGCSKSIPAFEMVMRAKNNVYHLDCFACQQCHQRFCVGDRFYLLETQILCEFDYEERLLLTNNYDNPGGPSSSSAASSSRNICTTTTTSQQNAQQLAPNSHGIQRRVSDIHQSTGGNFSSVVSNADVVGSQFDSRQRNNEAINLLRDFQHPKQQQHRQLHHLLKYGVSYSPSSGSMMSESGSSVTSSSSGYGSPDSAQLQDADIICLNG